MTITWIFNGRPLSSDDKFTPGGALNSLQLPLMFKIGKVNGKERYGYFDYEELRKLRISHTKLAYAIKKCAYGVDMVGAHEQGIIEIGDDGGLKVRFILLGNDRIASYTILSDVQNNRELVVFNKAFGHDVKEENLFHEGKTKRKIYLLQSKKTEEEAKDDEVPAMPAGLSPDNFIKYTLTYHSELLGLVLQDPELYQQILQIRSHQPTASLLLDSLLSMVHENGYAKVDPTGVTEAKWSSFFSLALERTSPYEIENTKEGDNFALFKHIVRINREPVLHLLNNNGEWRDNFWQQLQLQKQNPLELFFSTTKINADLFKRVVDLNHWWLLDQAAGKANYFTRLALYLEVEANRDNTLQAVVKTNLNRLPPEALESLITHFASQRPFNLEYCRNYLGLHLGFTSLFSAKTNQEVIIPLIKETKAPTDIIELFHFFKPCLRPKGKGFVLEHLIGTGGIHECDQAVVLELFSEMPNDIFIERFNQYLDNGGNNWLIYNQFLDNFPGDLTPYATRLLKKLTSLEGGNINHSNQKAVWNLFNAVQGGAFLENFERYLDRGGNDWRVYNKFLEEFKGDLSHYTTRLFLRLIALGEEKLLTKFTRTGIDLTQTIEDLKSGKLKLPVLEASSAKPLDSLSSMLRIRYPLTTVDILFLMEKSDNDIVDFCLTEGNEDLKVAILRAYQDRLQWPTKLMLDHFSKAITINPALAAAYIVRLTKATTGREILDVCIQYGNEVSTVEMLDILEAYKGSLYDVSLSVQEILFWIRYEKAVEIFNKQIKEIGLKALFETLGEVKDPVDIAFNLLDKDVPILRKDLEVLYNYPWAKQFAESFLEHLNKQQGEDVNFHIYKSPNGERVLVFEVVGVGAQRPTRNTEQSILQGNGIFNEGRLGNIVKGANIADLSINSVTRVIKLIEEPNVVDGGGLAVNVLLLFREVRPNNAIARFAGNTKTKLVAATIKTMMDFYNHGPITGTIGLLSNFVQLVKFGIYKTSEQAVRFVTVSTSLAKSVVELQNIIYPSEQCEILLFIAPKFDPGILTAVKDNTEALKARGYDTFLFNEPSSLGILATAEKYRKAAETFKAKSIPTDEKKLVDQLIKTFETTFELIMRPTFFTGFNAYNVGLPENVVGDENAYIATNAKALCANGSTKQIFLSYNMQLQPIQNALRKENFKTTAFTVWEAESICDGSIKNAYLEEDIVKTIDYDMSTYKCPIRNASLGFSPFGQVDLMKVATLLNLGEVIILDSYQHPQLNSSKAIHSAILKRIDSNTKPSKPRLYFEMTASEIQEAAMRGNEELQYSLGSQFMEYDRLNLAAQWYRKAAEGGFLKAKASLAGLLSEQPEFSIDPNGRFKEARRWAEEAVNEGSIDGLWIMGRVLEYNEGDLLSAEDSYRNAAEQGHVEAKNSLVEIRKKMEGDKQTQHDIAIKLIEKKPEEAKIWLRKAANLGFALSQAMLASLLMEDDVKDIGKKWVDRAAKRTEAKEWAEKAAKQGFMHGQEILGLILREDYSVKEVKDDNDLKESAYWFKKALNQGSTKAEALLKESTNAMVHLAFSLSRAGKTDEAKTWFNEATSYGPIQVNGLTGLLWNGGKPIGAKELDNKAAEQDLGPHKEQHIVFMLASDTDDTQAMCSATQSEVSAVGQCSLGSNDEESY